MPKRITLVAVTAFLLIFTACHKSNDGSNSSALNGTTWNFGYLKVDASGGQEDSTTNADNKLVKTAQFITTQNTGTVAFTSDSLKATGLGYSYNFTSIGYGYTDGVKSPDSTFTPYNTTTPPANSSSSYKLIGKDSIYFPNGGLISSIGGSTALPIPVPAGGHYVIQGDSLTITSNLTQSSRQTVGAVVITTFTAGTAVIVMKK